MQTESLEWFLYVRDLRHHRIEKSMSEEWKRFEIDLFKVYVWNNKVRLFYLQNMDHLLFAIFLRYSVIYSERRLIAILCNFLLLEMAIVPSKYHFTP